MDLARKSNVHKSFWLHGGNIEQEAQNLGIDINSLIDASASIAPFSLPPKLRNSLLKAIKGNQLRVYPDRSLEKLREAIGQYHKIQPSLVLPGNGASELITWAARDAMEKGISILPTPGFSDYQRALKCWDGKYIYSPLPLKWEQTFPQEFPLKITGKVIWITNPHNPTGQCWSKESLESLLRKNILVICDEAFLPLVPSGEDESLIPLVQRHSNLIVIRSLTKLFAIAGLRIGYAISSSKRLQRWQVLRDPWPLNGLAIAIGIMIMRNPKILKDRINEVKTWVTEEGNWLHTNLQTLEGIISHPSSTNFQLIEGNSSLNYLRERLLQKKILLRDCRSFIGLDENWLRISLQNKSDNRKIFKAIKSILNNSS